MNKTPQSNVKILGPRPDALKSLEEERRNAMTYTPKLHTPECLCEKCRLDDEIPEPPKDIYARLFLVLLTIFTALTVFSKSKWVRLGIGFIFWSLVLALGLFVLWLCFYVHVLHWGWDYCKDIARSSISWAFFNHTNTTDLFT